MAGASAKTAVVYFSATGTTERMAKNAAQAMGADIIEIQPVHKYTKADLNWRDKKSLTTIECNDPSSRPAIANKIDIAEYDTVVVCYPIWWAIAANDQLYSAITIPIWLAVFVFAFLFLAFAIYRLLKNCDNYMEVNLNGAVFE